MKLSSFRFNVRLLTRLFLDFLRGGGVGNSHMKRSGISSENLNQTPMTMTT